MRRGIWNVSVLLCLVLLVPMVSSGQSPSINYYPANRGGTFDLLDVTLYDEMCGGAATSGAIGGLGWAISGSTGATSAGVSNRPCVLGMTNGASQNGALWLPGGGNTASYTALLSNVRSLTVIAAFPSLANQSTQQIGLFQTNPVAQPTDDAVYFQKLNTDTNWFAVTRDGADPNYTRTDTGVAFSGGTYVSFRIEHPASQTWQFYINDALVATHTSVNNAPAEASATWAPTVEYFTTGTVGTALIDFASIRFTSAR